MEERELKPEVRKVLKPEVRKAFEDFVKSFHAVCISDCTPPTITEPATDVMREGLIGVSKLLERIKSVNYNKGETEIKIEIVIGVPPKIPSAVFVAKNHGGQI